MKHGRQLTIALLLPLLAWPVAAQTSAVCENLLDQLASTPAVIGTMPGARRYSSALTQQSMQIRQLRVEMRRMGCSSGSIVVFGGDHRAECGDLQAELDGLEDDKQAILDQRDAAGGRGRDNGRSSILAALETNGCLADGVSRTDPLSQEPEAEAIPDYRQVRGFDGNRDDRSPAEIPVYRDEGPSLGGAVPSMRGGLASADGGLRTMCVRTCDGAFFPISANASPQDFPHQADLCAQRCPGAQTELYFHSTTSQESADMVSTVTGAPYRSLPTAFAYKDRPPGQKSECGCTMAAGAGGAIQNRGAAPQSTAAYSGITDLSGKAPAGRQVTPPKPITTEAAVPKIVPPVVSAPTTPPAATASVAPAAPVAPATPVVPVAPAAAAAERPYDPNNKVRVVGPQFLPAQQTSSINLADPAVKGPQPLQQ